MSYAKFNPCSPCCDDCCLTKRNKLVFTISGMPSDAYYNLLGQWTTEINPAVCPENNDDFLLPIDLSYLNDEHIVEYNGSSGYSGGFWSVATDDPFTFKGMYHQINNDLRLYISPIDYNTECVPILRYINVQIKSSFGGWFTPIVGIIIHNGPNYIWFYQKKCTYWHIGCETAINHIYDPYPQLENIILEPYNG